MPRSPSPLHRRPERRYRDDSPPYRYRPQEMDRDGDGDRTWRDYHRQRERRDWDDRPFRPRDIRDSRDVRDPRGSREPRDTERERERDRYRDRSPPPIGHGSSRGSPSKPTTTTTRSASPEEGQITSPIPPPSRLPIRPRSPFSRRSPSPPSPRYRYERDSDRDRWGERFRERDRPPRRSRSPPPYSRSPSPSTISTRSRSSRYPSPTRRLSPEKRPYSPAHAPFSDRRPPMSIYSASPDNRPVPLVSPQGYDRKPSPLPRLPPSGPKSERTGPSVPSVPIPTGPRALSGGAFQSFPKSNTNPYIVATPVKDEKSSSPVTQVEDSVNPYAKPTISTPGGRLSWSERKNLSPNTSTGPDGRPPSGPSINPYRPIKPEPEYSTDPVRVKMEPETTDIPVPVEPVVQVRDEEARVMADLPVLKDGFGPAQWELDLAAHYKHVQTLIQQTNRAQSAARVAAAVLADAEAERIAAGERRKIVEAQLVSGTLGVGLIV